MTTVRWDRPDTIFETGSATSTPARGIVAGVEEALADAEVYEVLLEVDFSGPAWDRFAVDAARYALGVLSAWMSTGQISQEVRAKRIPVSLNVNELHRFAVDAELRDEFANIAVAEALRSFRDQGRSGSRWSAQGGASLKTWILGACVFAFVNELKKVRRARERHLKALLAAARAEQQRVEQEQSLADPAFDEVSASELLRAKLAEFTLRDRNIVWGKAAGRSNAEIAELFGERSPRAVAERWTNLRASNEWIRRLNAKES
ncbi:sigma-70 RNA polymerase sigma factor region 4 domain-containing protein [Nocardia fluminea]|uniref:hypothetical protein n=1 Tax=Nocardia fluminea TaxID=134984 RepID=UPI00364B6503